MTERPSFTCPHCGMTSSHPDDVREGYCGNCHDFTKDKHVEAKRLEEMMVAVYGPDFREKVITGPLGSFRLADCFEECGLTDPKAPPGRYGWGLWQTTR